MGFLIGMAILWGLTLLVIDPIANYMIGRKMEEEGVFAESFESLPEEERKRWEGIATRTYILWDVIILGIAGFAAGYMLGITLIGISFSPRGWPGMIAFIGLSFLGASLKA